MGQSSIRILCIALAFFFLALYPVHGQSGKQTPKGSDSLTLEEKRVVSLLRNKLSDLEAREEEVSLREKELKILHREVEDKLKQMRELRQDLQKSLGEKRRVHKAKIKELSGIYENMNAARAAQAMLSMDRELAIGILANMRRKLAGEVLDQMPGKEAAEISRDYSNMGGGKPPP
ncbi:MAG: MotE family protein [Desulfovermiculus sp.]